MGDMIVVATRENTDLRASPAHSRPIARAIRGEKKIRDRIADEKSYWRFGARPRADAL